MKFTRQLEYNAYAPWHAQYINFKKLKRVVKQQRTAPLSLQERWEEFVTELEQERTKYRAFFVRQLDKTVCECEEVVKALSPGNGPQSRKVREECLHLFLEITELTNFINLNLEGTRKAAKKFDKFNGSDFQRSVLLEDPAFENGRALLQRLGERLTVEYAAAFTGGDRAAAAEELSRDLSDLVVWDKGTIWNDLLRLERSRTRLGITRVAAVGLAEPVQQKIAVIAIHAVFIFIFIFLNTHHFLPLSFRAQKCLGVLLLVSALWSLGSVPLFATSLAIPVLLVSAGVLREDASPALAAKELLGHFWGSSQCLVLASFTLASGLSKLRLDRELTNVLVARFGSSRRKTLFTVMLLAFLVSGVIGNVAASVLGISTVTPILQELPRRNSAAPWVRQYAKVLLLGVAVACNLGGMISPVASPQNVIAFSLLAETQPGSVSFGKWCVVGGLVGLLSLLLSFAYLVSRGVAGLAKETTSLAAPLLAVRATEERLPPRITEYKASPWTREKAVVVGTCAGTLWLWLSHERTVALFGDAGLASLMPVVILFSLPNFLTKADFLSLPWDVCILISGGSLLGFAVSESGLLLEVGALSREYLTTVPASLCVLLLCAAITAISTFVSHTAAANVLMPFILEIATTVNKQHAAPVAMAASLCLSAGMALPISSFPNMNSISVTADDSGTPWLLGSDFFRVGLVLGSVTTLVAATAALILGLCFCRFIHSFPLTISEILTLS